MPGQLRSRSQQILCGRDAKHTVFRQGFPGPHLPVHPRPVHPRRVHRAVSILRPPYFGRSTVIDSQYNTLFKSRSIPAEAGHRFAACSAHRLFRHPDGPKRPGNAAVPRRGRFRQAFAQKKDLSFPGPPVPASSCPHPVGTQGTAVPRANGFPAPPAALPPVPSHLPDHFPTSSSLGQFPPCWLPLLPFRPISPATRRSRRQPGRRRGSPFPASRRLLRA